VIPVQALLTAVLFAAAVQGRWIETGPGLPAVEVVPAEPFHFPGGHNPHRDADFFADCNSPGHWSKGKLYVFNSWEQPSRSSGPGLFDLKPDGITVFDNPKLEYLWLWIESTWQDDDGTLYAWYHHEIPNVCPPREGAAAPGYPVLVKIGALRSRDDGAHWEDLGYILESARPDIKCFSGNAWYAGGPGDFIVYPDRQKQYFYIYFANYSTDPAEQGICAARLPYKHRNAPSGKVERWHRGAWREPGLGGHSTPILPASVDVYRADGQTFWGPVIHWNTYLNKYVMILNRIQDTRWRTEGIYILFSDDVANPTGWSKPVKIMDRDEAILANPAKLGNGWYAEIFGMGKGETDKIASQAARLFLDGQSRWEIRFHKPGERASLK
jgi:hypothetical protein